MAHISAANVPTNADGDSDRVWINIHIYWRASTIDRCRTRRTHSDQ